MCIYLLVFSFLLHPLFKSSLLKDNKMTATDGSDVLLLLVLGALNQNSIKKLPAAYSNKLLPQVIKNEKIKISTWSSTLLLFFVLQAFDRVLHFPFPHHIHCHEGPECCGYPLCPLSASSWCPEKGRSAQDAVRANDLPPFLATHARSPQAPGIFHGFAPFSAQLACHGSAL